MPLKIVRGISTIKEIILKVTVKHSRTLPPKITTMIIKTTIPPAKKSGVGMSECFSVIELVMFVIAWLIRKSNVALIARANAAPEEV